MQTLELVIPMLLALLRGWYRTSDRHSQGAKHACNVARDGKMNRWVGEISDSVALRLQYYRQGNARLYKLATGTMGRMA